MARVQRLPDGGVKLWLSARDTYDWAHRTGAAWSASVLSGRSLFVEFAANGDVVDINVRPGTRGEDIPSDEFSAITSDYLKERTVARNAMTLAQAKNEVYPLGFTIKKTEGGDYVLKRRGTSDDAPDAYFTPDLDDAVGTARAQSERGHGGPVFLTLRIVSHKPFEVDSSWYASPSDQSKLEYAKKLVRELREAEPDRDWKLETRGEAGNWHEFGMEIGRNAGPSGPLATTQVGEVGEYVVTRDTRTLPNGNVVTIFEVRDPATREVVYEGYTLAQVQEWMSGAPGPEDAERYLDRAAYEAQIADEEPSDIHHPTPTRGRHPNPGISQGDRVKYDASSIQVLGDGHRPWRGTVLEVSPRSKHRVVALVKWDQHDDPRFVVAKHLVRADEGENPPEEVRAAHEFSYAYGSAALKRLQDLSERSPNLSLKEKREFERLYEKWRDIAQDVQRATAPVGYNPGCTHGGPWQTGRCCTAQDMFLTREGMQCGNCGKVFRADRAAEIARVAQQDEAYLTQWERELGENPARSLSLFVRAYITAALWTSMDESTPSGGEPMDKNYTIKDIAPETLDLMSAEASQFEAANWELIHYDLERAGHDFWLTRNGHGAGFWDGDWPEPAATQLTNAAHAYGEFNLYVGDDDKIHGQ